MTTPVAVVGLTYDGTDVQDADLGLFLEIVKGLNETPEVRGTDTTVPGLDGRIPRNRVTDRLAIELRGMLMATGMDESAQRSDFATMRQQVRMLFDPTKMPADLVAELEDGSTATISARPLPTLLWRQGPPGYAELSVELESVDPDWVIVPAGS